LAIDRPFGEIASGCVQDPPTELAIGALPGREVTQVARAVIEIASPRRVQELGVDTKVGVDIAGLDAF
jgi:hypothetical protein